MCVIRVGDWAASPTRNFPRVAVLGVRHYAAALPDFFRQGYFPVSPRGVTPYVGIAAG